jgi:hypothetical protein
MTETLGERTARVIVDARISPRILASLTPLHYTTVYSVMNGTVPNRPVTAKVLEDTLDGLERLVKEGVIPLVGKMTHKEMSQKLADLLNPSQS